MHRPPQPLAFAFPPNRPDNRGTVSPSSRGRSGVSAESPLRRGGNGFCRHSRRAFRPGRFGGIGAMFASWREICAGTCGVTTDGLRSPAERTGVSDACRAFQRGGKSRADETVRTDFPPIPAGAGRRSRVGGRSVGGNPQKSAGTGDGGKPCARHSRHPPVFGGKSIFAGRPSLAPFLSLRKWGNS